MSQDQLSPMQQCVTDLFVERKNYLILDQEKSDPLRKIVGDIASHYKYFNNILNEMLMAAKEAVYSTDDREKIGLDARLKTFIKELKSESKFQDNEFFPIIPQKLYLTTYKDNGEELEVSISKDELKTKYGIYTENNILHYQLNNHNMSIDTNKLMAGIDNLLNNKEVDLKTNAPVVEQLLLDFIKAETGSNYHLNYVSHQYNKDLTNINNQLNCFDDIIEDNDSKDVSLNPCYNQLIIDCTVQINFSGNSTQTHDDL